ncbi:MAG: BamA/TamA family outer membrane protein, partial [Polyangiaceae bacterium]|nr:BamA/TamA family outer membrane protein [Polyangiaceae bacterium]
LGNELKLEFRQPVFFEARTTLGVTSRWDIGPDPNQPNVFRHDLDQGLVVSRPFFGGRLLLSNGFRVNLYRRAPGLNNTAATAGSSDYQILFLEQFVQVDLRDNARQPRQGAFFSIGAQEAGLARPQLGVSSWRYFRITPEARAYAPLPAGMVLAARFGMGAMFIDDFDADNLDPVSQVLGPTRYRLRGGGPTSHRGYSSAQLGWFDAEDGRHAPLEAASDTAWSKTSGGIRRWEASLELRVPITQDFGTVVFADMGDVNRAKQFRFNYIHLAVGIGFRYQTIVGPLRVDLGVLVPGAQVIGGPDAPYANTDLEGFADQRFGDYWTRRDNIPGSINITIGEAF